MPTPTSVQAFVDACDEHGFRWSIGGVRGDTVTLSHSFEPGDNDAFVLVDTMGVSAGYLLPRTGSVYGTEGVGGDVARRRGFAQVHITGVKVNTLKALRKVQSGTRPSIQSIRNAR